VQEIKDVLNRLSSQWNPVVTAIFEVLESDLESVLEDETLFIGNDISVAPKYFQIIAWPAISEELISRYENLSGIKIPSPYRSVLGEINGVSIFGLNIFGIPKSMLSSPQTISRAGHQCLDIGTANKHWCAEYAADPCEFMFASRHYSRSENCAYFIDERGCIKCYLKDGNVIASWPDWEAFIVSEVQSAVSYEASN